MSSVQLPGLPEVPWSEVRFVAVVETAAAVLDPGAATDRNGDDAPALPSTRVDLGLADGRVLRHPLDPTLRGRDLLRVIRSLMSQAESHAVPQGWLASPAEADAWEATYLEA